MALTATERQQRRREKLGREEVNARARAWYRLNCERLRVKRQRVEFRAKRREYMRAYRQLEAA